MHRFREKWKIVEDYRDQFLGNHASELVETAWVGYYRPYAFPHEIGFEMDARIWRKCKNGWRWWRQISWKPWTGIGWNCLGMLPSSLYNSPCNIFANGCTVFKLGKKQIMFYVFFSSKHSASFCMEIKTELGLWYRHGDDGGGVWILHEDLWTLEEASMFVKLPFWKSFPAFCNFYRNFL